MISTLNWRRLLFALFVSALVALGILILYPAWLSWGLFGFFVLLVIGFYFVTSVSGHALKVYFDYQPTDNTERPLIDISRCYYIVSKLSGGMCLDVPGSQVVNKTPIELYALHNGDNQQWKFLPAKDEYYYIVSKLSGGMCLDVPGSQVVNKTPIELYALHNAHNQQWKFLPA